MNSEPNHGSNQSTHDTQSPWTPGQDFAKGLAYVIADDVGPHPHFNNCFHRRIYFGNGYGASIIWSKSGHYSHSQVGILKGVPGNSGLDCNSDLAWTGIYTTESEQDVFDVLLEIQAQPTPADSLVAGGWRPLADGTSERMLSLGDVVGSERHSEVGFTASIRVAAEDWRTSEPFPTSKDVHSWFLAEAKAVSK